MTNSELRPDTNIDREFSRIKRHIQAARDANDQAAADRALAEAAALFKQLGSPELINDPDTIAILGLHLIKTIGKHPVTET